MKSIKELYSKRAKNYDFWAGAYRLMGVRIPAYRRQAVEALRLTAGDTVLELGCGTGLNIPYLEEAVGEEGKIIGLDLTPAMLAEAEERVRKRGWENVELIQADASEAELPDGVDGVLSTFALSIMPDYRHVVEKAAGALVPGGRLVILDLKLVEGPLSFLNSLGVFITRPFGGSYEVGRRRPWEEMEKHLTEVRRRECYLGFVYVASGTRRAR